ncbi:N-formylglutamate amidohydrolase [Thioalkalivibrio sp. HK1]|uniref:N-formylglutamate amidohydrolase n=1 Tax=Thioalkalivibrio sp. HK1 TaxID=1469245 RepID=UPI0004B20729|nr:N-formylglutamate amidohydrolase [Thioalkalivibrio sp. HK1]
MSLPAKPLPDRKIGHSERPLSVVNPTGAGPFLLVCEHASNHIPAIFGNLGLDEDALASHIAWDIGAGALAEALGRRLDAPLIRSEISRLVYDCNRPLDAPDAIVETSDHRFIPGNAGLDDARRRQRKAIAYTPFCSAISETARSFNARFGRDWALVTIHSFTPVYDGKHREVEIGILHDRDTRLADAMLASIDHAERFITRRNEPYAPVDGVTHTVQVHGLANGVANAMIEVRNDLLEDPESIAFIADLLADWLRTAMQSLRERTAEEASG